MTDQPDQEDRMSTAYARRQRHRAMYGHLYRGRLRRAAIRTANRIRRDLRGER